MSSWDSHLDGPPSLLGLKLTCPWAFDLTLIVCVCGGGGGEKEPGPLLVPACLSFTRTSAGAYLSLSPFLSPASPAPSPSLAQGVVSISCLPRGRMTGFFFSVCKYNTVSQRGQDGEC